MHSFFEEDENYEEAKNPSFSFYDFKKWISKQGDSELKNFLDENAETRKNEKKEELKGKFKKRFKEKLENKRKRKKD
jgi:hypothetical protein